MYKEDLALNKCRGLEGQEMNKTKSFGLVSSLFNGISTFVGYLMPKPFS